MWRQAFLLFILSPSLMAEPQWWMEKEDPYELPVFAVVEAECPLSAESVESMAEGVLMGSGITPVSDSQLFLGMGLDCYSLDTGWGFALRVDFVGRAQFNGKPATVRLGSSYGAFGQAGAEGARLRSMIKSTVARALADYLKANFDQGE